MKQIRTTRFLLAACFCLMGYGTLPLAKTEPVIAGAASVGDSIADGGKQGPLIFSLDRDSTRRKMYSYDYGTIAAHTENVVSFYGKNTGDVTLTGIYVRTADGGATGWSASQEVITGETISFKHDYSAGQTGNFCKCMCVDYYCQGRHYTELLLFKGVVLNNGQDLNSETRIHKFEKPF